MKPKKIKARKMWASTTGTVFELKSVADSSASPDKSSPSFTLPADAASVEAMVEQMARAIIDTAGCPLTIKDLSRAALAAIGIKASK